MAQADLLFCVHCGLLNGRFSVLSYCLLTAMKNHQIQLKNLTNCQTPVLFELNNHKDKSLAKRLLLSELEKNLEKW